MQHHNAVTLAAIGVRMRSRGMSGRRFTRVARAAWIAGAAVLALGAAGFGLAAMDRPDPRGPVEPLPVVYPTVRPEPPPVLAARLHGLAAAWGEPVGLAVKDVDQGWVVQVAGEQPYPQQSVSKLWVALAVLDAVDRGELALDQEVVFEEADRSVFFQPIVKQLGPAGYRTSVRELMLRALAQSDNAANDKLIRTVGGVEAVDEPLRRLRLNGVGIGAEERDLQARIAGLTWRPEYGYGRNFQHARAALPESVRLQAMDTYLAEPPDGASPLSIVQALSAIKRGEVLSPVSTEVMLAMMAEAVTGPNRLKGGLPFGWSIAHKTGTGQDLRGFSVGINDVGLLTEPDGRTYAVAVMMRRTARPVPERLAFMQSVSRAIAETWAAESGPAADLASLPVAEE